MTRRGLAASVVLLLALALVPTLTMAGELPPGGTFIDDDGNTHEGFIEAIAAIEVTLGCSTDPPLYCPDDDVTRGQMASFLDRAFDFPAASMDYFADDDGTTHEASINDIAEAGVTLGFPDGTYQPDGTVTREQMGSFIARAMNLVPIAGSVFDDVSGTHEGNINAIADAGVTLGCSTDPPLYCPTDNVRRDQMASFIGRALGLDPIVPPPPTTTTTMATTTSDGSTTSSDATTTTMATTTSSDATTTTTMATTTTTMATTTTTMATTTTTMATTTTTMATTTTTMAPTTHFVVTAAGNNFSPNSVSATTGDTVQWDNDSGGLHDVTWDGGEFPGSGAPSTSAWTYSETFTAAGTYNYHCSIHVGLGMTGTITVTDP